MAIFHYNQVDTANIQANFINNGNNRLSLTLPFKNHSGNNALCVIGQNPSYANNVNSDKTISYIERLIHTNYPKYSHIVMLNLFSRVDTPKAQTRDLLTSRAARDFRKIVKKHHDFLIIYGKLSRQGAYNFVKRAQQIRRLLKYKNVYKIDIGTKYAPHPGNPKILYKNYTLQLSAYTFSDIPP